MIDTRLVKKALAAGVVFNCAMCEKFWWGIERGLEHCKAVADKKPCAGPFGKQAYPEYAGPLRGHLHTVCFVCGDEPSAVVEVLGKGRIGVCKAHVSDIESFSKKGEAPPFVTHQILQVLE